MTSPTLCSAIALAGVIAGSALTYALQPAPLRVIDGDTIARGEERIRIANIDAPEIFHPECLDELALGWRAAHMLEHMLAEGHVGIHPTKVDIYGRTIAMVTVNGADAGQTLIEMGLARPWRGRKEKWC